jgi:hypothetical protein
MRVHDGDIEDRAELGERPLVRLGEAVALLLVDELHDAHHVLALLPIDTLDERHTQQRAHAVARLPVNLGLELRVLVRVLLDVDLVGGGGDAAGEPGAQREVLFGHVVFGGDARKDASLQCAASHHSTSLQCIS